MDSPVITKLIKKHWDGQLPVKIRHIATSMGITLKPLSFDESFSSSVKTRIINQDKKLTIEFNTRGSRHSQDIAIAHAVARIAFNQVKEGQSFEDGAELDLVKYNNENDMDANEATYQILTPAKELKKAIDQYGTYDPEDLAGLFDTHSTLIYKRMRDLGLVEA